jgi:hypothetical protein
MHAQVAEVPTFTTTGSLRFHASHVFGPVANSQMKCATFAMLVLARAVPTSGFRGNRGLAS